MRTTAAPALRAWHAAASTRAQPCFTLASRGSPSTCFSARTALAAATRSPANGRLGCWPSRSADGWSAPWELLSSSPDAEWPSLDYARTSSAACKAERKNGIVTALGIFGFLARAFVFAMIGVFLLFAAINSRSSEAKGFAGALGVIQQQPYGAALLGITAAGLLAFGLYGIAEAAYRRISPP
jgi:hypothetical protein